MDTKDRFDETLGRCNALTGRLLAAIFVSISLMPISVSADYIDADNVQYESLDYIKSTGDQWIVTDITPTCTDRVKMKLRLTESGRTQCLYCSRGTATTQNTFTAFYINNVVRCDRNANVSTSGNTVLTTTGECTLEMDYDTRKFYVNGTLQSATMAAGTYSPGSKLMLFASHRKGSDLSGDIAAADVDNKAAYRLHYFELYASGSETPKHRLMPARRKLDSVAGLYDTVTGKFYGPASNSGAFVTYCSLKNITAKQRYPWNGLVDVGFTITGDSGVKYNTSFAAQDVVGGTNITMKTVYKSDGTAANVAKESFLPGDYHLVWDAAADLPDDWQSDCVTVTGTAEGGQEGVQLWEGGPYWATRNIGAGEPWEYGYFFWWGETIGYERKSDVWVASNGSSSNFSFTEGNTQTYNKSITTLQYEGWVVSENGTYVLTPEHDAAHVQWGGAWRIPTYKELYDLCNSKCDWTWMTLNGVNGYVVCGRGDYAANSIFLPCAGYGYGTSLGYAGSSGYYWSSVPVSDFYARDLNFVSSSHDTDGAGQRRYGRSIRPVQSP